MFLKWIHEILNCAGFPNSRLKTGFVARYVVMYLLPLVIQDIDILIKHWSCIVSHKCMLSDKLNPM